MLTKNGTRQEIDQIWGNKSRSVSRPLTDELRMHLVRKDAQGRRRLTSIITALLGKADDGDMVAIKEIFDRIEGKVQPQEAAPSIKVMIMRDNPEPIDAEVIRE